jgi:hypothetical protein
VLLRIGCYARCLFPNSSLQNCSTRIYGKGIIHNNRTAVLMKSTQGEYSHRECLLNMVAPSGRPIEACVFTAAQDIATQAVSYAGKFLADSCIVINLLEEAAATVSDAIRAKEAAGIAPIQDVGRYLFRVFLRKVAEAKRSEAPFERASRVHSHLSNASQVEKLDSQLLLDRILGQFDSVTREMILRRMEGHSWNEIALEFGLSNHAARLRFSKAIQRLRRHMETARNEGSESTPRKAQRYHRPRDSRAQRVVAFERRLERMFTPAFYREFHQLLRSTRSTESF